jgi:hypothetical protein
MAGVLLIAAVLLPGSAHARGSWGLQDRDGDGLNNAFERSIGSNPFRSDTDGDGWSDWTEYVSGSDDTDPSSIPWSARGASGVGRPLPTALPSARPAPWIRG